MPKKQARSKCPCNGTGLHPHQMIPIGTSTTDPKADLHAAGAELFNGTPEAAVAAAAADGSNDGESIFRKMELDDISMSQEDLGRSRLADLSETADGLAEMEEPGEANAIDMSDSSWNTLTQTEADVACSGASQPR